MTLPPCLGVMIRQAHPFDTTTSCAIAVCLYRSLVLTHLPVGGRSSKAALEHTRQRAPPSEANTPVRLQRTTTKHASAFTLRLVCYPTRKHRCRKVHCNGKAKGAGGSWDRARLEMLQYKRMPCMVQGQWRMWTWRMGVHIQMTTTVKTVR